MKKFIEKNLFKRLFATMIIATMFVTGCSKPAEDTSTSANFGSTEEGATNLEMWVFVELHGKFYEEMVNRWNEENPEEQISLKATTYPYDDMHSKLLLSLQSGTGAPDLCDVEIGQFPNFLKGTPQLMDLNSYIEPYKGNVVASRLNVYSKDGVTYGVPTHVGAMVEYYNTEVLEGAGVDYTQIVTWDDYTAAGLKVKEAYGDTVFMGPAETSSDRMLASMLAQQGTDIVAEDGTPLVNSPEMIKAYETMKSMQDQGVLTTVPGGHVDVEECYGLLDEGGIASMTMPLWFMSRFTDYMPSLEGKIAIAPVPVFEEGMPRSLGYGGTGTVVTNTSENQDLAARWLTWAKLSELGNEMIWNTLGFDPVNTDIWTNEEITHNSENAYVKYFKTNPFDTLLDVQDEIQLKLSTSSNPSIGDVLNTTISNDIFENGADITETLNAAQEAIVNTIQ